MRNKKGQITIFIIIGIIIVVTGLLIFLFRPEITATTKFDESNPYLYIHSCLEEEITETVNKISIQGGVLNPTHIYNYKGENITYLCYTNQYETSCTIEQPMMVSTIQSQLTNKIKPKVDECFDSLEENYKSNSYTTELKKGILIIDILPKKIYFNFSNYNIKISKKSTEIYKLFDLNFENNLYTMIEITNNIISEEIEEGDSLINIYMDAYPELKIEKKKQLDETTIYIITNEKTQDKFQFAVRSHALSPNPNI